jgi:hypothetical protein
MLTHIFAASAALVTLTTTVASAIPVPDYVENLSPIAGQITSIQAVRVPVADNITGSETRVSLRFALNGCLDSLLPVVSHSEVRGRRATIYVTALNAHNPESALANCVAMPEARAEVSVPGLFNPRQVRVVFLGVPPEDAEVRGTPANAVSTSQR